jgi:hypothetical protein
MKSIIFLSLFLVTNFCHSQANLLDKDWKLIGQEINPYIWNNETNRYGRLTYFYYDSSSIKFERPNFIWFNLITLNNKDDFSSNSLYVPNSISGLDCNDNELGFGGKTMHPDGSVKAQIWLTISDKPIFIEFCNKIKTGSSKKSNLESNNIESAKNKCSNLGFKTGTEGFGKCVLQLSK